MAKLLKVRVDRERCQGHARCFALAPELFALDPLGNGRERGDGTVAAGLEAKAWLAKNNCPELAIDVIED
jgi:ferredoxin